MLSPQVCLQPKKKTNTHARNTKKTTHTKTHKRWCWRSEGLRCFLPFTLALSLSPSLLLFFLFPLSVFPPWFGVVACVTERKLSSSPPPSVESFPSSSPSLPLSPRLNATEPRSHAARENTQSAAVLPYVFRTRANVCARARARERIQ